MLDVLIPLGRIDTTLRCAGLYVSEGPAFHNYLSYQRRL